MQNITHGPGVKIIELVPGKVAEESGLKVGDEIMYVQEQMIDDILDFNTARKDFEAGDIVAFLINRNHKPMIKLVRMSGSGYSEDLMSTIKRLAKFNPDDFKAKLDPDMPEELEEKKKNYHEAKYKLIEQSSKPSAASSSSSSNTNSNTDIAAISKALAEFNRQDQLEQLEKALLNV